MSDAAAEAALVVDLVVEDASWGDEAELSTLAEAAARAVAAAVPVRIVPGTEVAVVLTDDAAIRTLNRDHRGFDKPTNVLSFPMHEPDEELFGPLLGDVVVARETVAREAAEAGLSIGDHLAHMLVHGLLHLFGYDHLDDEEAEAMERLETQVLATLGVADPYAGTEPAAPGAATAARAEG